jgi:DNA-directed RNA polymerase beta subunit
MTDIQNSITKYFRVANEKSIDIPMSINPLVYDSLKYKIVFPSHIAYNKTFTDIIDVVNTPENNNVNRLNELNICTTIKDGVIYITCYKYPTFEKITLPYLEYLNKRVLSNEHVNYDDKMVIESDEYKYKLRQKVRTTNSLKDIELIEPAPDEKLSITTRRIPMVNMSDSVRVAMGASMSKQAVEVYNSEPALVSSGNDDVDYMDSSLITTYFGKTEGVVDMISDNTIFIKSKTDGSVVPIQIPIPTVGSNDSLISFETKLKVGDTIKPRDVVVYPKILVNKSYDLGVNTNVLYMNYLGYTYEDGVVVSESYAEKLTHYSVVDVAAIIRDQDIVSYIKKIGSRVKSKDILVGIKSKLRARQSTIEAIENKKGVLSTLDIRYNNNDLIVPNNIDEGYVVDVLITETEDEAFKTKSDVTKKTIDEYSPNDKSHDYDHIPNKYKEMKCQRGELRPRSSYLIQFKIIRVNRLKVGDKVCNRWGSKGMISLIVPDHLMPRIDLDGHGNGPAAEILLNPAAIVSRKNPSQLYETVLTKIINEIYEKCNELVLSGDVSGAKKFTERFYGDKFTKMTDDEFMNELDEGVTNFSMKVGSYSKISYETISEWAKDLGVKETDQIYAPDVIIETGHPEGRKVFDPKEYNPTPGTSYKYHELGFLDQPVITGKTYIMKLYHSADYTGKVTSSVVDSGEPYMGRGLYRDQGQKLGEMEFWSLLSHGTEKFICQGSSTIETAQYQFLNELLLAGYTMIDSSGYPILSPVRAKINELTGKNKRK